MTTTAGGNRIRLTEGARVLFEGAVPAGDAFAELPVGALSAGERSTLTVECLAGAVILRELRFAD